MLTNISLGANFTKLFTSISNNISHWARDFVPERLFPPSLMFVSKASCLPKSGTPEIASWVDSSLTCKNSQRWKRRPGINALVFLQRLINNGRKFHYIGPSIGVSSKCFVMSCHNQTTILKILK